MHAEFRVVKGEGVPLLGRDSAMKLGVLKIGVDVAAVSESDVKEKIVREYPNVFEGVGVLKDRQVKLHVNKDVEPVAQPLRRTTSVPKSRLKSKS